ncbi:MAG: hypothetical protein AABX05_04180, partial [Nanoarchaeota archaeon]
MTEQDLKKIVLETYESLEQRADSWGLERIAYENISNHFPADSQGTSFVIYFEQKGEWREFLGYYQQTNAEKKYPEYDPLLPIENICFLDNGIGYDYIHLVLRHSTKKTRQDQTGMFGEGLKMASAAELRHNITVKRSSKDWIAQAFSKKIDLAEVAEGLYCQEVTTGNETVIGSQTVIYHPPRSFVRQVLSFRKRIFYFRKDLPKLELDGLHADHKVFADKLFKGELFVKNIRYQTKLPLYLTYQINGQQADNLLSPDRNNVLTDQLHQPLA